MAVYRLLGTYPELFFAGRLVGIFRLQFFITGGGFQLSLMVFLEITL